MVNTKIRLIVIIIIIIYIVIFIEAKDGEALYSQQKQDR